jgi:hypothetical protein
MNIRNLVYLFALSLVACQNNSEEVKKTAEVKWTPGMKISNVSQPINSQTAAFRQNNAGTTAVATTTGSPKVNPPHGQYGHRCDLAVGAPLPVSNTNGQNIAVQQGTNVDIAALAQAQQAAQKTAVAATAKGMNPPHGQPHHRCDLPVGAPLNSDPAKYATTTTPAPQAPTFNAQGKMLNPPHGQPNHRCDIAVGEPLDSKPVQSAAPTTSQAPVAVPTTTPPQTTSTAVQKVNP